MLRPAWNRAGRTIPGFRWALGAALVLATSAGCKPNKQGELFARTVGVQPKGECTKPGITCDGDTAQICSAGLAFTQQDCTVDKKVCAHDHGCLVCIPSIRDCDGNTPRTCRDDGSGWELSAECDTAAGLQCNHETGACGNLCEQARFAASYIGCEYWPTVTANPNVPTDFAFALAVSNPQTVPAHVTIDNGDPSMVISGPTTIDPGKLSVLPLPWQDNLKNAMSGGEVGSLLEHQAAFRLTSDVPVTVYQFNALQYRLNTDCSADDDPDPTDGQCFSYTNDASLLLPTYALTGNYLVMARESELRIQEARDPDGKPAVDKSGLPLPRAINGSPGFVSIIGVDDAVHVTLSLRGKTAAAADGSFPSYDAGGAADFDLARGDVLQLLSAAIPTDPSCDASEEMVPLGDGYTRHIQYCKPDRNYDLTGTRITANGKVAVIAGHACAFVPYNRWACDHLEDSMFPMETWGREFAVAATHPLRNEPNVVRVLAQQGGTEVSFDPGVHDSIVLNEGEFVEFEFHDDFLIHSSGPLAVGLFLVGQDYAGIGSAAPGASGDPAFALLAPIDQYRSRYSFLASETYDENWITVVASRGQRVELDGRAVSRWYRIGTTDLQAARVPVQGGPHDMRSDQRFGVIVYGFGSYTSYLYSAGLDFRKIVRVE